MPDGAVLRNRDADERYQIAAPGANTNFLTNITPRPGTTMMRIAVALRTSSVLNLFMTDGTTTELLGLNSSDALNAGDLYLFSFGIDPDLAYNLQVETDGVIEQCLVHDINE